MAKLTTKAIQDYIRNSLMDMVKPICDEHNGEQFANYSIAIPVTLEGKEYWGELTIKSKYAGEKKPPFDPFEAAEEWKIDQEVKAHEKELKAKAKANKIARDKAKRKAEKEE